MAGCRCVRRSPVLCQRPMSAAVSASTCGAQKVTGITDPFARLRYAGASGDRAIASADIRLLLLRTADCALCQPGGHPGSGGALRHSPHEAIAAIAGPRRRSSCGPRRDKEVLHGM